MKIFLLPYNRFPIDFSQKIVAFFEVPTAEKSVKRRKGAGVGSGENEMMTVGNKLLLLLCVSAPEHKNNRFFPIIKQRNNFIGEDFPAFASVGICHSRTHG